jgi:hypothetical protein
LEKRAKKLKKSKMEQRYSFGYFLWIRRVSLIDKSVKIILAFPLRSMIHSVREFFKIALILFPLTKGKFFQLEFIDLRLKINQF